ncbi:putative 3-methyladenine DNA glycosylase [Paraliobacillus quinghaiensis]|uniref:Putative 3-methyladenine DNA glycosylase n=1 Tax=Paraliobacillus quinghaiensis TaxID=470815 RepID=A0A917WY28_9BACI|nr:DNA-3-methyladenine glycosylase [Paraliobacillus quinghaiensis]GGM40882.1 putative 3-methyladenine DNA glycosylase [Paraliobacillus quinghaiensis]
MLQTLSELKCLDSSIYHLPTLDIAKKLLGCILIKETTEGTAAGIIVETEAYIGPEDQASHSFQNRRTKRTEAMFGRPGTTYMYTMHTHNLFNVVTGKIDQPEAVLIRAVEPIYNIDLIRKRRSKITKDTHLTNGPGKLTKALGIDMADYGHDLTHSPLWIASYNTPTSEVVSGPRIGIDNAGDAKDYPWRFWLKHNKYVSK